MNRFQSLCSRALTRVHAAAWLVALCVLLTGTSAFATTTINLSGGKFQGIDPDTSSVLSGGLVCTFLAGTSTPVQTYTDSTGNTLNSLCVTLDGGGLASIWLDPTIAYKLVVKKSDATVIYTLDGVNTAVPLNATTGAFSGAVTFASSITVTGTAALGVITTSSTTKVTNLNADLLDGGDFGSPPAGLGSTVRTPGNTQLTNLDVSGTAVIGGTAALNGNTTLATAKTFNATDVDSILINSVKVSTNQTVPWYEFGTQVDAHMWIAPRAGKVVSIKEIHSVVGGASCAVRPRKITDTSAPGVVASATVKEITQANFDCTAAINTTQTGTLSATASDYTFAAGDKIALDMSGTQTGLVGMIVMEWQPQ